MARWLSSSSIRMPPTNTYYMIGKRNVRMAWRAKVKACVSWSSRILFYRNSKTGAKCSVSIEISRNQGCTMGCQCHMGTFDRAQCYTVQINPHQVWRRLHSYHDIGARYWQLIWIGPDHIKGVCVKRLLLLECSSQRLHTSASWRQICVCWKSKRDIELVAA